MIVQLFIIGGVVFAAARFGVVAESKQVIENELTPPTGMIYMGIDKSVKEELEPLKTQAIRMDTLQETIMKDIDEIKKAVKEIAKNGT